MSIGSDRLSALKRRIRSHRSVAIAFSGGVDSSVVAALAQGELADSTLAITVNSQFLSEGELRQAKRISELIGIRHVVQRVDILSEPGLAKNQPDRCYVCKRRMLLSIAETARESGIQTVLDGTNSSDRKEHRPGARALRELDVRSPLAEARFNKNEVRAVARKIGLPVDEMRSATCLATRLPYGDVITSEKLEKIGKAEEYLASKGFDKIRVRLHGDVARVEVAPEQVHELADSSVRRLVLRKLKSIGFVYVTVDLQGYRSGSMDEVRPR